MPWDGNNFFGARRPRPFPASRGHLCTGQSEKCRLSHKEPLSFAQTFTIYIGILTHNIPPAAMTSLLLRLMTSLILLAYFGRKRNRGEIVIIPFMSFRSRSGAVRFSALFVGAPALSNTQRSASGDSGSSGHHGGIIKSCVNFPTTEAAHGCRGAKVGESLPTLRRLE